MGRDWGDLMLVRIPLLSFLILAIGSSAVYGQARTTRPGLHSHGDFDCLPAQDLGLSNIRLRMRESDVLRSIGKPISITKSWAEDDGGRYDVFTYHYATMRVDIVRGEVDGIYTNSPKQKTPEHIRVGDGREAVVKKLGATPRDWKRNQLKVSITVCPQDTKGGQLFRDDNVTYEFGRDGRLISITFEVGHP